MRPLRRPRRNRSGQAHALTAITAVKDGHLDDLAMHLDTLPLSAGSPLARVDGLHFARWVILEDVVFQQGQRHRDHLRRPRLLFTANFDGELAPFLEAMRTGMGADAEAVWGHCAGWPGTGDPAAFAAFFDHHAIQSSLFFAAYGHLTVADVHRVLRTRDTLRQFGLDARQMDQATLKQRFLEAFPARVPTSEGARA